MALVPVLRNNEIVMVEADTVWTPEPAPSTDPNDYMLNAFQFEKALVLLGIDRDTIKPTIKALYDAQVIDLSTYADYLARWVQLKEIKRNSPVMAILKPTYSITDAQIDAAWLSAADVEV